MQGAYFPIQRWSWLRHTIGDVVPTDEQTLGAIILMIGMAVGIDYSLFYLRREREERQRGHSPHEALLRAARTSGQAVLVSGATVLIAMAGMFVSGNSLFSTIGLGTMIVVLAAMIGSLTVLPALLHRLGDRVDFGRVPLVRSRVRDDGPWGRFIAKVLRRPVLALLAVGRRARTCSPCPRSICTRSSRTSPISRTT